MKNRSLTMAIGAALVLLLAYVFVYEGFWVWVVENTVVPSNKMLIVIAKTGREMPPGHIQRGQRRAGRGICRRAVAVPRDRRLARGHPRRRSELRRTGYR